MQSFFFFFGVIYTLKITQNTLISIKLFYYKNTHVVINYYRQFVISKYNIISKSHSFKKEIKVIVQKNKIDNHHPLSSAKPNENSP